MNFSEGFRIFSFVVLAKVWLLIMMFTEYDAVLLESQTDASMRRINNNNG
jgi:hypothetical protein